MEIHGLSRRTALHGGLAAIGGLAFPPLAPGPNKPSPVRRENRRPGSPGWDDGLRSFDDLRDIQGYPSSPSVDVGESIAFHVSTGSRALPFRVEVYRIGHYAGAGARFMMRSPVLQGSAQPVPRKGPHNVIRCGWKPSWRFTVPRSWTSGLYVASFVDAHGRRGHTPFVVRDDRARSAYLVVLPFTTYQAYNLFPANGVLGASLYYGYVRATDIAALDRPAPDGVVYQGKPIPGKKYVLHYPARARTVSFERPYAWHGLPSGFHLDLAFIRWAESMGLDLSYATSLDLHAGRVRPARHRALVFSGHDEYWSSPMRHAVERAITSGVSVAFMAANNVYWRVRLGGGDRPDLTCFKTDPDPGGGLGTSTWRVLGGKGEHAEQRLLGTQYLGIVTGQAPLIVRESRHWFWKGTGVRDGDALKGLVVGEADGLAPRMPRPAARGWFLSESPVATTQGGTVQRTSLYRAPSGAWVFNAGTLGWTPALLTDARIRKATANLMERMARRANRR
ncbi:N,N-dimethylformamidase beta subunit family domain-containing protein [Nonomuraea sp. NPDC050310]|uniref:N,N-dimethylformamidase beta subunit family domain-containing protein n=1 Tax=Nonomuraea sp. NPDC050310 TaxID=3154935 RepID=UPI0033E25F52